MKNFQTHSGRELRVGLPKHHQEVPDFMKDFVLDEKIPKIPRDFDIDSIHPDILDQAGKKYAIHCIIKTSL